MNPSLTRRRVIGAGALLACGASAHAQSRIPRGALRSLTVAQIVDTSAAQQDVSKDFLIGSRAAWQDINARGGVRGRAVNHMVVEVDGSAGALQAAVGAVGDNPECVVLSGTAGDRAATAAIAVLQRAGVPIAHLAPWLQNSNVAVDERTFPIFAGRQEQVAHALRSLANVGVSAAGAVYATDADFQSYREAFDGVAAALNLKLSTFRAEGDLTRLGQRLTPGTPAVLLFIGGTPELVAFTQGLERQQRQRYVIALSDVNLQTVAQLGASRVTPVIATQPVPAIGSAVPVVRAYRETLARLFDEPPAPLSLAGFIAARYTFEVLNDVEAPTRSSVLASMQRRAPRDIGGFRVAFDDRRRASAFVTQSMLTSDGRIIG